MSKKKEAKIKEEKLVKLNLACGQIKEDGWIGVDIAKTDKTDIVFDLRKKKWPWKNDSVDEVTCSHFVEHLTGAERITFFAELYRVMKKGAKATIVCPYWSSMRSVQDPTHQWPPVCEATFLYFNKAWREQNKLDHYDIHSNFDFTYGYSLAPHLSVRNDETKQFAIANYVNSVMDLHVTMTKI